MRTFIQSLQLTEKGNTRRRDLTPPERRGPSFCQRAVWNRTKRNSGWIRPMKYNLKEMVVLMLWRRKRFLLKYDVSYTWFISSYVVRAKSRSPMTRAPSCSLKKSCHFLRQYRTKSGRVLKKMRILIITHFRTQFLFGRATLYFLENIRKSK